MEFRIFKGTMTSWEGLFTEAATFASTLGPARVRQISHSASNSRGIVVVWYDETEPRVEARIPLALKFEFERGTLISWEDLFTCATRMTDALQREQVVSISHSDDQGNGLVVVWYWAPEEPSSDADGPAADGGGGEENDE